MSAHTSFGFRSAEAADDRGGARHVHLTPREREVLSLLSEGLPNKLISRRLNISGSTVKVHMSNILREIGASNRVQAVIWAHQLGLLAVSGDLQDN